MAAGSAGLRGTAARCHRCHHRGDVGVPRRAAWGRPARVNADTRTTAHLFCWRLTRSSPGHTTGALPAASTAATSHIPAAVVAAHALRDNARQPLRLPTLCPQPDPTRAARGHGAAAPHLPMLTAAPCRTDSAFPMAGQNGTAGGRTGEQRCAPLAPRVRSCRPPRPAPPPPTAARGADRGGPRPHVGCRRGGTVMTERCSSSPAAARASCFGCAGGGREAARGLLSR